jgi:electron transfer flavoprotein beta subunit
MKIAVLVKQVPDTDEVKMDPEKGTMVREGVGAIMNPLDMNALEADRKSVV